MQVFIKEEVLSIDSKSLGKKVIDQCLTKIKSLEYFPKVSNIKKLKGVGSNIYRIRSGDYRILFSVNGEKKIITVFAIDHRKDVYKYVHKLIKRLNN